MIIVITFRSTCGTRAILRTPVTMSRRHVRVRKRRRNGRPSETIPRKKKKHSNSELKRKYIAKNCLESNISLGNNTNKDAEVVENEDKARRCLGRSFSDRKNQKLRKASLVAETNYRLGHVCNGNIIISFKLNNFLGRCRIQKGSRRCRAVVLMCCCVL